MLKVIIVEKATFIFGLVAFFLLSPSVSGPVLAQAKSESTDCARWLKLIDSSAGKSSGAINFPIPENEKLAAMECFLQSEGNQFPSRIQMTMSHNGAWLLPPPTIEIAALYYYVTYMFEEKWDHAFGIALWDKKDEINPPGAGQEAYRCYREWFGKLKELGFAEVRKQGLGPLDDCSVQWFLMGCPEKPSKHP